MKPAALVVALLAVAALPAASALACSMPGTGAPAPRPTPSAARVDLGDVAIGALFPTSGPDAEAGTGALDGVRLAAEVLNGEHPGIALPRLTVGRIVLDAADTGGDPEAAAGAVDRLVRADHVAALTGALQSDVTAAASEQAERLSVPMVAGSAAEGDLTERSLRWFWRVGPSDRTDVLTCFAWLHSVHAERPEARPIRKVVVVHSDDAAGRDGAALLEKLAPSDIMITEDVQLPADGNMTPEVQRLDGYAPDAVVVIATVDDSIHLVRTMARVGYTPPALLGLGDGFADPQFASDLGPLADYAVALAPWSPEIGRKKPAAAAAAAAFREEFGRDMTGDSALDFETMLTLGEAIEAADSTDPLRIRAALERTNTSATIMGWRGVRFDSTGQNALASSVVEQITNGLYHVVYPRDVASTDAVWPMPPLDGRA